MTHAMNSGIFSIFAAILVWFFAITASHSIAG